MKRILLTTALVAMSVALFAESLPMRVGAYVGLTPTWMNSSISNASTVQKLDLYNSYSAFDVGAFFDAKYIRVDLGFGFSLGGLSQLQYTNNALYTNASTNTWARTTFDLQILGKYPFEITSGIAIWPAVGLEWEAQLYNGYNSTNDATNAYVNNNHFWLKAGIGADFKVTDNIYIVPSVIFGLDLTPCEYVDNQAFKDKFTKNLADTINDNKLSWSNYKLDIKLGVAYKF